MTAVLAMLVFAGALALSIEAIVKPLVTDLERIVAALRADNVAPGGAAVGEYAAITRPIPARPRGAIMRRADEAPAPVIRRRVAA